MQIEGDIYNDEHLLSYVRTGLHIGGAGVKQVKRVEKLSSHYKYDANTIYYRKNDDSNKWVEVPPVERRKELIEKAHLHGHFQSGSTYNRLREQ